MNNTHQTSLIPELVKDHCSEGIVLEATPMIESNMDAVRAGFTNMALQCAAILQDTPKEALAKANVSMRMEFALVPQAIVLTIKSK